MEMDIDNRNEVGRKLANRRFRIYDGGGHELTPDTEMRDLSVYKIRRNIDIGNEIEYLQSLSLLELAAKDNANSRILKGGECSQR